MLWRLLHCCIPKPVRCDGRPPGGFVDGVRAARCRGDQLKRSSAGRDRAAPITPRQDDRPYKMFELYNKSRRSTSWTPPLHHLITIPTPSHHTNTPTMSTSITVPSTYKLHNGKEIP